MDWDCRKSRLRDLVTSYANSHRISQRDLVDLELFGSEVSSIDHKTSSQGHHLRLSMPPAADQCPVDCVEDQACSGSNVEPLTERGKFTGAFLHCSDSIQQEASATLDSTELFI